MSTKSNQVFLNQIFDEAVSFISDVLDSSIKEVQIQNYCSSSTKDNVTNCVTTTSTTGGTIGSNFLYIEPVYKPYYPPVVYGPIIWVDVLRDFIPTHSKKDIPSYPVSNYYITNDGTSVIEIAVSGFSKEDIEIKREDLKLLVKGKRKSNEEEEDRKYFYRYLACRDFELEYTGSSKWEFDELEAAVNNGILTIKIPIKDEFKPVRKTYEIQ